MADSDSTPGKSPAFRFYPSDFVTGTITLTTEEVGAYILLMCHCWDTGGIPGDIDVQARITRLTPGKMRRAWSALESKFIRTGSGFTQARLERERQKQIEYRDKQHRNGKHGGRPSKPKPNPDETQAFIENEPNANPDESFSAFSLQPSVKRDRAEDPAVLDLAGLFLEQIPTVFAQCRSGANYPTNRIKEERDFAYACELARGWPSLERLLKMYTVFLKADLRDKNVPGTPGQFLHMAPEMDALLRKNGQ